MNKPELVTFEGYYITVSFDTPHYLTEFVEYPIRVTYSCHDSLPGETFTIQKRYSDFDTLKRSLKSAHVPEKFPPKRYIGKFDMTIVNERQVQLEKFLKCLIKMPIIGKSIPVINFLQKSHDFIDYDKLGFQQVSLDFRCETNWQVQKVISEMGCRAKKCYLTVNSLSNSNKYILNWTEYGPEYLAVNLKNIQKFLKSLNQLKHEYIYPITQVILSENGASFIKPFSELGSLYDLMYKAKPLNSILNKYSPTANGCTPLVNEVSMFGRQILIGLKYLHDKGIPYGHLHLRNVLLVTDKRCALTDIENTLMGLVPQDRYHYVGILKKLTFQEIDIYCFGRLVYEMVFCEPLPGTYIENDDILKWPSPSIREFLMSVLTESILKNGLPAIDALLDINLFKSYNNRPIDKSSFKIQASTKEFLDSIQAYSLKLLTTNQKQVKAQRRKAEADEIGHRKKQQRKDESRRTKKHNSATVNAMADIDIISESIDSPLPNPGNISSPSTVTSYATHKVSSPAIVSSSTEQLRSTSLNKPLQPPPPPPGPAPPPVATNASNTSRVNLLSSIQGFTKNNLKKAKTNDRSTPKV